MGMSLSKDTSLACRWAPAEDALYRAYHDTEWGVPVRDPVALFAKLQLDGMQAGLSWITILRKRDAILDEFDQFEPERLARWTPKRIEKALKNPGIIRSKLKTQAAVTNAQNYLGMQASGEEFSSFLWDFVKHRPIITKLKDISDVRVTSPEAEAMTKALKARGFKFCGPVIVYAFMQAVGMVNDHETRCPRFKQCQEKTS
jgi:DNA-3-methyladenine glycosylase I